MTFLKSMLAADVALMTAAADTAEARAFRAVLHLTTQAGQAVISGGALPAGWRDRMAAAADVLCPALPAGPGCERNPSQPNNSSCSES